jgi:hypothetical protein
MTAYDPSRCYACEGFAFSPHADWCSVGAAKHAGVLLSDLATARDRVERIEWACGLTVGSWLHLTREKWLELVEARIGPALPKKPEAA